MPFTRSNSVQNFIDNLLSLLENQRTLLCKNEFDMEPLFTGLKSPRRPNDTTPKGSLPALKNLDDAIQNGWSGPTLIHELMHSFLNISNELSWYRRKEPDLSDFMQGHANAFIIGPNGLEERGEDVLVGVSLLAPKVSYPDHRHPPEELYIVMSEGEWRQNDAPWHSPGIGGFVHNPSNIIHSMRAKSKPLLAIWCLWQQPEPDQSRPQYS